VDRKVTPKNEIETVLDLISEYLRRRFMAARACLENLGPKTRASSPGAGG
jgi:hypothetical protein